MFTSYRRAGLPGRAALFIFWLLSGALTTATAQPVYNSIPSPLPSNVGSMGLEDAHLRELGDGLILTLGPARRLIKVSVVLSSFACTSGRWFNALGTPDPCVTTPGANFSQPITLNLYAVNPDLSPGMLLGTSTQTFHIPYRPSSNAACASVPGDDGEAYLAADGNCYHGLSVAVTFDLTNLGISLPDRVIAAVTYNTTSAGYAPIGSSAACVGTSAGCPYDALDIATDGSAITGANIDPDGIYANWINSSSSCSGSLGSGLRLDTPCWTGFHPQIAVTAGDDTLFLSFFLN